MASIRKRNKRCQVQVRSRIYGSISKSFHRKSDAQKWAIEQEALMQSGQWSRNMNRSSRISDLLSKYLTDVTPKKRHPEPEKRRLSRLLKDPIANHYLETFDSTVAAQFRDRRLGNGARTKIGKEKARQAVLKHGYSDKAAIAERKRILREIADIVSWARDQGLH